MKRQIIAFGASNSRNSINKKLANFVANQVSDATVELLDLNDYEMSIYSIDRQKESGIPELAYQFLQKMKDADGLVISLAEHNGAYTAAFKNIFDWASRIEKNVWQNKPMFLLAASDGARGAQLVLEIALNKFSRLSSNVVVDFSFPDFYDNFSETDGIINEELREKFLVKLNEFERALD